MSELRSLAERNNGNLTDVEKVEEDLRAVNGRIEEIAEGNQDRGELSSMKKRILDMKASIHQMSVREGVIRAQVERLRMQEHE